MPHFTLQLTQQSGPILTVVFSVSAERHEALTKAGAVIPKPVPIRALLDTGASSTCVDPSVFKSLSLTPTGTVQMVTPSTGKDPVDVDQYDVGIIIPGVSPDTPPFVLPILPVCCTDLAMQGIHALIGRDVLEHCVLTYNGSTNLFILAY
ncbi:MAG: aspartyl protease family protein [Nitrospiraceae bacterium]|nr:aspartyl protease family protein [Nitrospiraceae bacterium]